LSSIGAIWLVCDLGWTNFYTLYGRFGEIDLLHVMSVFQWLNEFVSDVLLGIDALLYQFVYLTLNSNTHPCNNGGLKKYFKIVIIKNRSVIF
jgi:hypothetical protein